MNVIEHVGGYYTPSRPSVKEAIDAKIKVLREFYIVDSSNEREIRGELQAAINAKPGRDYELVLDQVAHTMIMKKLE